VAGTPAAGEAVKAKEYRYHFDLNAPGKLHPQARTGLLDFYDQLVDRTAEQAYNIADHLPVSRRQRHGLLSLKNLTWCFLTEHAQGPLKSGVDKKTTLEIIGKVNSRPARPLCARVAKTAVLPNPCLGSALTPFMAGCLPLPPPPHSMDAPEPRRRVRRARTT
jgi:hypothetical protein